MSFKFLILIALFVLCFLDIGKAENNQKSFRDIINNISTRRITSFDSIYGRRLPIKNVINSAGISQDQVENNSKSDVIIYKQRSKIFFNGVKDESNRKDFGDGKRVGEN